MKVPKVNEPAMEKNIVFMESLGTSIYDLLSNVPSLPANYI